MKIENQVCSLELSKKLKELGVKQESLFWWGKSLGVSENEYDVHHDCLNKATREPIYSAFTTTELGEMLPSRYLSDDKAHPEHQLIIEKWPNGQWHCVYVCLNCKGKTFSETADTEADARAKMLIYLLENKLIEV